MQPLHITVAININALSFTGAFLLPGHPGTPVRSQVPM
jgi:hypothetical protein